MQRYRRFRVLWIVKINAAAREWGVPYSLLQHGAKQQQIAIDRKTFAALAATEPITFRCIVDECLRGAVSYPFKRRDISQL